LLLKNKVALVTAGASGMGRAAAELFAENGAHVIVVDMNEPQAQETVDAIVKKASRACDKFARRPSRALQQCGYTRSCWNGYHI
jgi:NAD(P)-dependent dehydrogenase (short-subunit alcohol dehydrogenase family)